MTKRSSSMISDKERFAIIETLRLLKDVGVKVDAKTSEDDILELAARMVSFSLGKPMSRDALKVKINEVLGPVSLEITKKPRQ